MPEYPDEMPEMDEIPVDLDNLPCSALELAAEYSGEDLFNAFEATGCDF